MTSSTRNSLLVGSEIHRESDGLFEKNLTFASASILSDQRINVIKITISVMVTKKTKN